MRHRIKGIKLNRTPAHRKATLRNLAIALFTHGQITTTIPKAKALQPFAEHLVHVAKQGTLHARRQVMQALGGDPLLVRGDDDEDVNRNRFGEVSRTGTPRVVKHLVEEIAPRYQDRDGGYTRIIKLAQHRIGDGSDLCVIQLVGGDSEQGPQVAGQYSRRREQANKRMAYAAQLRKAKNVAGDGGTPEADESAAADESATATATATATADVDSDADVQTEPAAEHEAEASEQGEAGDETQPPGEGDETKNQ